MEISPRLQRIILIVVFILVTLLLAAAIYYLFFRPVSVPTNDNLNITNVNGVLPPLNANRNVNGVVQVNEPLLPGISEVADGGDTIVKDVAGGVSTKGGTLDADGASLNYFDEDSGQFYRISEDGLTRELLTDQKFFGVTEVDWAPDKDKVVVSFIDGNNVIYNFDTDKQYTLPRETKEFDFSPDSEQIAYKYISEDHKDENFVGLVNADGSNLSAVTALGDRDAFVQINWSPTHEVVATFQESVEGDRQELFFLGPDEKVYKSTYIEGRKFEGQFVSEGNQMLYSVYSPEKEYMPNLYIMDARGQNIGRNNTDLNIRTWAHKCTTDTGSAYAYCAVPTYLPEGAGMFPEVADNTPDIFYKINLSSGSKTLLANPVDNEGGNDYTADSLFVSDDGKSLYFTDKNTNQLHYISL